MNFKELKIWQEGFKLSVKVLRLTKKFPSNEKFSLTSQLNRAAISIPSNIAEGHGRVSKGDFLRFCNISRGSCNEVETQLLIAQELDYISPEDLVSLQEDIHRLLRQLTSFQKTLQ